MRLRKTSVKVESEADFIRRVGSQLRDIDKGRLPLKAIRSISFTDLNALNKALSPERLKMLRVIQHKRPENIGALAGYLKMPVHQVRGEIQQLERLGFVDTSASEPSGGRRPKRGKPITITIPL